MRSFSGYALVFAKLAIAATVLSSCATQHGGTIAQRAPDPALRQPLAGSTAKAPEALWHLRAGLNVAALSCRGRGRAAVAGAYGRLLSRHRAVLDAAYRAEQDRYGVAGLDHHQTRLYNRFANQRSPERFCAVAANVAARANAMASARLAPAAPQLLAELQAPLR
jgi:hypothetical protein